MHINVSRQLNGARHIGEADGQPVDLLFFGMIRSCNQMVKQINRKETRARRQKRVRSKISGTAARPRLNVFRSSKHIYAQLIDDAAGVTLASASSLSKGFEADGGNKDGAFKVGEAIAKAAKEKGIEEVVFDRAGYLYHGRVASLADGARQGGLKF